MYLRLLVLVGLLVLLPVTSDDDDVVHSVILTNNQVYNLVYFPPSWLLVLIVLQM